LKEFAELRQQLAPDEKWDLPDPIAQRNGVLQAVGSQDSAAYRPKFSTSATGIEGSAVPAIVADSDRDE
jgi:hypothetical protein